MFRELKYQTRALNALREFFKLAYPKRNDPDGIAWAFSTAAQLRDDASDDTFNDGRRVVAQRHYNAGDFAGKAVPWVCLRLPTGAGKTYLAACAIGITAKEWLGGGQAGVMPLVLWLVPTDMILQQTLNALKDITHPYREALARDFGADIDVISLSELPRISPSEWGKKAVVIVSTGQALKIDVEKKDMRNVYAHTEDFETQFVNYQQSNYQKLADEFGLERITLDDVRKAQEAAKNAPKDPNKAISLMSSEADIGKVKWSAINVLRLQKPIVIVDEAHKAQGDLSKEVLQRINASSVIELTATPKIDNEGRVVMNVLYHVSAQALKAENMVKLPVIIKEHLDNWQGAVADAVFKRAELEQIAQIETQNGGQYIRPIMLLQAESETGHDPTTPEKLKAYLIEAHKIPGEQIAIATGKERGLNDVDLMLPSCQIRFVITVQALVEGWDCPFAYVLCSIRNMKSNTAIVQLLGRVLRMPYAERRGHEALNCAYAYTITDYMGAAASELRAKVTDKEKGLGFDRMETNEFFQPPAGNLLGDDNAGGELLEPKAPEVVIKVKKVPDLSSFSTEEQETICIKETPATDEKVGEITLVINGKISEALREKIIAVVPNSERENVQQKIEYQNYSVDRVRSPMARGVKFALLPRMCVMEQGELVLLERDVLINRVKWNLATCSPQLAGFEVRDGEVFALDMQDGKLVGQPRSDVQSQATFEDVASTEGDLIFSLEESLINSGDYEDISPAQMAVYLKAVITHLKLDKGYELSTLVVYSRSLLRALAWQIDSLRKKAIEQAGTQLLLVATNDDLQNAVQTSLNNGFEFKPYAYPVNNPYIGAYSFNKHYYPQIDGLKNQGEEFECAKTIDIHTEVEHWVRNLVHPDYGFWLPTHDGGHMYPDFVCQIKGGKILLIEYKGGQLLTAQDAINKRAIGELWARKSGNGFLMATSAENANGKSVYMQIDDAIAALKRTINS